jgi:hypothetical protein
MWPPRSIRQRATRDVDSDPTTPEIGTCTRMTAPARGARVADGPGQLSVSLTFAGLGVESAAAESPTVLPTAVGESLRPFFDANPAVEFVQFELALSEDGDDLVFAGGTLHGEGGEPLHVGREAERAGALFRRLLRDDPHLAELPVRLAVAMEGIDHTFRIAREATGAERAGGHSSDADDRAARRERARLERHDARHDQRDVLPEELDDGRRRAAEDDHAA